MPPAAPVRPTSRRGFTLVEILIVIGVIAVLLSIGLPVLRSVRINAVETAVVAYQREVGLEVLHYTTDHDSYFPYYGIPGTNRAPIHMPPASGEPNRTGEFRPGGPWGYWGQSLVWWWFLELEGYNGELSRYGPEIDWTREEEMRRRQNGPVAFDWFTRAAFANPRYFRRSGAPAQSQPFQEHAPQRIITTTHPSRKGMLLRMNRVVDDPVERPFVFFVDGHAEQVDFDQMRTPVPSEDGLPVLDTEDGLHGRDL